MRSNESKNAISFIICTYNQDAFLKECIESILNINGFNGEKVVIVNDGSTDKTSSILDVYKTIPALNASTL